MADATTQQTPGSRDTTQHFPSPFNQFSRQGEDRCRKVEMEMTTEGVRFLRRDRKECICGVGRGKLSSSVSINLNTVQGDCAPASRAKLSQCAHSLLGLVISTREVTEGMMAGLLLSALDPRDLRSGPVTPHNNHRRLSTTNGPVAQNTNQHIQRLSPYPSPTASKQQAADQSGLPSWRWQ